METLLDKYRGLEIAVKLRIRAKILEKGQESEHRSEKVLKVKEEQRFTLGGRNWLTEISATELIDNIGLSYDYYVLDIEKLCEAIDNA